MPIRPRVTLKTDLMRTLTQQEKRTIRIAAAVLGIFALLYGGLNCWKLFQARRSAYALLVREARDLKKELKPYETRVPLAAKLMEEFHMDPASLSRATLVADASAAIQKAATAGGVQLGPLRESRSRSTTKEVASIQLEGSGPVPAVIGLLNRLESVGFPVILDSIQLNPDARPGMLKLSLTIIILDFDQWKTVEVPNA